MSKALSIPQTGKFNPSPQHYELARIMKTVVLEKAIQKIGNDTINHEPKTKHTKAA